MNPQNISLRNVLAMTFLTAVGWPSVTQAQGNPCDGTAEGTHGVGEAWTCPPIEVANVVDDPAVTHVGLSVGDNIVVDERGRIYLLVYLNRAIQVLRSDDQGLSWFAPGPFTPATSGSIGTISLEVRPDGAEEAPDVLHVVWLHASGPDRIVAYSRSEDLGETWTSARLLSDPALGQAEAPQVSVDRHGFSGSSNRVHVAWHVGDHRADDVVDPSIAAESYYIRSSDAGDTWPDSATLLSTADGRHSAFPRFNFSSVTGDFLLIPWRDHRGGAETATPTDDHWDVYAAVSSDGGATWEERLALGGARDQWDPVSLVTPDGVAHLGIMEYSEDRRDVRVHYARSTDGANTWSSLFEVNPYQSRFPHLLHDYEADILWFLTKDERDAVSPRDVRPDVIGAYSSDNGLAWSEPEFATDHESTTIGLQGYAIAPDGSLHINYLLLEGDTATHLLYVNRARPDVEGGPVDGSDGGVVPPRMDDPDAGLDGGAPPLGGCSCTAVGASSVWNFGWVIPSLGVALLLRRWRHRQLVGK